LQSKIKFPTDALVTISGPAGSGKSHCATSLAELYGVECHSSGSIFRKMASERGISLADFSKIAEKDPRIDKEIDKRTEELAEKGGCILEGRLVSWFSSYRPKLSFYLDAPFGIRAKRIAEREGITDKDAIKKTRAREKSERARYKAIYGLDIADLSVYDFVINTAVWDKDSVVELLKSIVDLYIAKLAAEQSTKHATA